MGFAIAAIIVLAAGGFWLWPTLALVEGGTPRLEADRTEIDLGTVVYGTWVTASF
jgi:hypothetical protein